MGPHVLRVAFLTFFIAFPEYLTMLWMVKAGNPILARLWKMALCTMTVR
jgi:hypothetical protein